MNCCYLFTVLNSALLSSHGRPSQQLLHELLLFPLWLSAATKNNCVLYNFPTSTDRPFCRSYHVFNFICFDKFIGILSSMSLYACTPGVSRCSISGAYISYKLWRKQILVYRIQYHPVTNYIVKPRISFLLPSLTAVLPETDGFRISPRTSVFLMRFYKKIPRMQHPVGLLFSAVVSEAADMSRRGLSKP